MSEAAEKTCRTIETKLGNFYILQAADGTISTSWDKPPDDYREDSDLCPDLAKRLKMYFTGRPVDFSYVPLPSGTEFFRKAWQACRSIKHGTTISYSELARKAGSKAGAARAAGQAMRRNPLPVIIPCHRVVGADGKLHGYSGSRDPEGKPLNLKKALLDLEKNASA